MSASSKAVRARPEPELRQKGFAPPVEADRSVEPATPSPARALQASLAAIYGDEAANPSPEPAVVQWPGWARLAFIVGAAASSWGLVLAGGAAVLRR